MYAYYNLQPVKLNLSNNFKNSLYDQIVNIIDKILEMILLFNCQHWHSHSFSKWVSVEDKNEENQEEKLHELV